MKVESKFYISFLVQIYNETNENLKDLVNYLKQFETNSTVSNKILELLEDGNIQKIIPEEELKDIKDELATSTYQQRYFWL